MNINLLQHQTSRQLYPKQSEQTEQIEEYNEEFNDNISHNTDSSLAWEETQKEFRSIVLESSYQQFEKFLRNYNFTLQQLASLFAEILLEFCIFNELKLTPNVLIISTDQDDETNYLLKLGYQTENQQINGFSWLAVWEFERTQNGIGDITAVQDQNEMVEDLDESAQIFAEQMINEFFTKHEYQLQYEISLQF